MASQEISDIHQSPAQAVIDATAKDVINYYTEERAALAYAPVMQSDRGENFPTRLLISVDGETWSELPAGKATPVPLPDGLRPTAEDWQPSCEVTPSPAGFDLGGFEADNLAPKKISISWPQPITAYLCRLPYSPLKSWPWRRWFGAEDKLPMHIDGLGGVTYHPQEGDVIEYTPDEVATNCAVVYDAGATPYGVNDLLHKGEAIPIGTVRAYQSDYSLTPDLFFYCGDAAGSSPHIVISSVDYAMNRAMFIVSVDLDKVDGQPETNTIYLGLYLPDDVTDHPVIGRAPSSTAFNQWSYESVSVDLQDPTPLGFALKNTANGCVMTSIVWMQLTFTGLKASGRLPPALNLTISFRPPSAGTCLVVATKGTPPPLNPYTGNYAPFVIGRAACRADILNSPKLRGRLTDMRLPACAYDIVLHWWSEDGKSYALPFKAVAVERSAKVASETKTDSIAGTWQTASRTQYNTMRGETQTRYRCAMELDDEEQRTAATLAESPYYCYTAADDENTRHWCEVDDVKTEWSSTETAAIEITIIDI